MMDTFITMATNILSAPPMREPLYLDPGSGSILIQLIIASALGAALIFKTSWSRIKGFFRKDGSDIPEDDATNNEEDEQIK
jgi:hypothetical protein